MSKIKVAVIGCGTIANAAHIPSYMANEKAEIKYFCDIIPERAEKAVKDYGCGIAVTDYKEVLADKEVEAVSICTPNNVHSTISIAALEAGKSVLCEKPAARIYSEALEMQKAQQRTGQHLSIGVVNRFNSAVNKIKSIINAGELGEVYQVYVSFRAHRSIPGLGGAFTTKSIAGGGALIDWGVHYLDIVMYCLGDPDIKTVSGIAHSKLGVDMKNYVFEGMWAGPPKLDGTYDVDDSVFAFIRTEKPAISLSGAWAQNIGIGESFIDFMGDKAGIRLNYGGDFTMFGTQDGKLVSCKPEFESTNMFQEEINAFVDSVRSGEVLRSNIDKAVLTSRIMQAIYDSSDTGREIVL
ncbi:MAG: Gfo/Idh/MocA family protein [Eubacteriales bacterium]